MAVTPQALAALNAQQQPQDLHPLFANDPGLLAQLQNGPTPPTAEPVNADQPQVGSSSDGLIQQNLQLLRQLVGLKKPSGGSANSLTSASAIAGRGGPFMFEPVPGAQFGDSFGAARYGGGFHHHQGEDLMAPKGTPIYAPFSGTLERDDNSLGGRAFHLQGQKGYIYGAHLARFAKEFRAGGKVQAGDIIGFVGNTGDASGGPTHLHFEWHPRGGDAVDPYGLLNRLYRGKH